MLVITHLNSFKFIRLFVLTSTLSLRICNLIDILKSSDDLNDQLIFNDPFNYSVFN